MKWRNCIVRNMTPEEYSVFIQSIFKQKDLVAEQVAKSKEVDKQAEIDEAKFILSLS